jgi:uncharacterized protein YecE (DUF72 family)
MSASSLRIGTSSWSSSDWRGPFYPASAKPADYLPFYAQHFDTVECDATFYGIPKASTVDAWRARTPEGFVFAAKLPQEITHDRGLVDASEPTREFLAVMERLGDRLGPILAQFPYVAKGADAGEYATGDGFRDRLRRYLDGWPRERALAVEVRNAGWIAPPLLDLLRAYRVTLAFSAYYTMPGPDRLFAGADPQTTDSVYLRFIGDHKTMDALVAKLKAEGKRASEWDSPALDRTDELTRWAAVLKERPTPVKGVAYFNNHYAGFAPDTARRFRDLFNT